MASASERTPGAQLGSIVARLVAHRPGRPPLALHSWETARGLFSGSVSSLTVTGRERRPQRNTNSRARLSLRRALPGPGKGRSLAPRQVLSARGFFLA